MTSITTQRFAYIRKSTWPMANERLEHALRNQFPEYHLDTFDVVPLLQRNPRFILTNIVYIFKEYGRDILAGYKNIRDCFIRTLYFTQQVKELMERQLRNGRYHFSVQIQSLFDAHIPGTPHFVYTDHTHLANLYYPNFDRRKLYSAAWQRMERSIYQNATMVFTRSSNIRQSVIDQYDCVPQQVACVYAGSNIQIADVSTDLERYAQKQILFVGMDWERKGGPALVEAFQRVLKSHPDAHLTIVGCSPLLDIPNCTVVGRVPVEEVRRFYQTASIFCLPTKLEPFGIAFVEALSYKLPVVGTTIGAVPDMVRSGENGYLVAPDNVEHLTDSLIELLNDPIKCQRYGQRGFEIATQFYTWTSVAQRMRQHIEPFLNVHLDS